MKKQNLEDQKILAQGHTSLSIFLVGTHLAIL